MARLLIVFGVVLLVAGLAWPWLSRLPLGRLPGDFVFHGRHGSFYLPLATSLIVSIVVSLLLRFFK